MEIFIIVPSLNEENILIRESIISCLQQHLYLRLPTTYRAKHDVVVRIRGLLGGEDKIKRRMIRLSKWRRRRMTITEKSRETSSADVVVVRGSQEGGAARLGSFDRTGAAILRVRERLLSRTGTQIGRLNNTPLTGANRSATLRT